MEKCILSNRFKNNILSSNTFFLLKQKREAFNKMPANLFSPLVTCFILNFKKNKIFTDKLN